MCLSYWKMSYDIIVEPHTIGKIIMVKRGGTKHTTHFLMCDHQGACGFSTPSWLLGNIALKSQRTIADIYKAAVSPTGAHQTQCERWRM